MVLSMHLTVFVPTKVQTKRQKTKRQKTKRQKTKDKRQKAKNKTKTGADLCLGDIEDGPLPSVSCHSHHWKYSLTDGNCLFPGPDRGTFLQVYPVDVKDQKIFVGFDKFPSSCFNDTKF